MFDKIRIILDKIRIWSAKFTSPFAEGVKEGARLLYIIILGFLLTEGISHLVIKVLFGTALTPDQTLLITAFISYLGKISDKYKFEKSKEKGYTEGEPKGRGLSPI